MHAIRSTSIRATLATMLLGGLFSVAALAAIPALPATASGPPTCTDTVERDGVRHLQLEHRR